MSSSSSSENEYESIDNNDNEIGLKPYMFEPTKSKTVVEYDDISSSGESSSSEDEKKITRIGNNSWCLCGCCHAMQTSTESLCCREMSEICELRLSGIIFFSFFCSCCCKLFELAFHLFFISFLLKKF